MQRYFATTDKFKNIIISEDDIFHIKKVMRMRVGDTFELNLDGDILLCKISSLSPFEYEILDKKEENHELNGYIRLLYCLPKGEKTDLVIQKSVELGVNEIVLINSTRSIAKITNENKAKKLERFNKIIKEASEQSKRTKLLKLEDVITFKEIVNYKADISLIAYENSTNTLNDLNKLIENAQGKTVNVIIGAEGGLTKEEVELALNNDYQEITLGKRILRSETACLYILSLLSFYMDR
ncbi:MAG: 16S rRNA (uracil(1498)-N(3))-methyltransferase [Bacilli bacterium]|nr:16S rRNA (uracil(1498)-N(3))-methyltransferase [Bacilli bacterium]